MSTDLGLIPRDVRSGGPSATGPRPGSKPEPRSKRENPSYGPPRAKPKRAPSTKPERQAEDQTAITAAPSPNSSHAKNSSHGQRKTRATVQREKNVAAFLLNNCITSRISVSLASDRRLACKLTRPVAMPNSYLAHRIANADTVEV